MIWALVAACVAASIPAGLRWLRIAQREHYLPPAVATFAGRWWTSGPLNYLLLALMVAGIIGSWWSVWLGFPGPGGAVRARRVWGSKAAPRRWHGPRDSVVSPSCPRCWRWQCSWSALASTRPSSSPWAFLLPALIDLALLALAPIERALGDRWVSQATERLASSGARVVAITGSYGKTTTKQYVAHLLTGSLRAVASPASFNNRMGLARAVNENLVPGTEVFVAEMGTYGAGEIAELCSWIRPEVAAIVADRPCSPGEVQDRGADRGGQGRDPRRSPSRRHRRGSSRSSPNWHEQQVGAWRSSTSPLTEPTRRSPSATARSHSMARTVSTRPRTSSRSTWPRHRASVLALGVDPDAIGGPAGGSAHDPSTGSRSPVGPGILDHRRHLQLEPSRGQTRSRTPRRAGDGGAGRRRHARAWSSWAPHKPRRTPDLPRAASAIADDIMVVGSTNRAALLQGSANGTASVTVVASRDEAVDWVRENLGPGDAVLYENDLPDHYP